MENFAVLGNPIAHSKSPMIHKILFDVSGFDGVYTAFDMPLERIAAELPFLKRHFRGLNCTLPLKEQVIPLLDDLDGQARLYGSVNTVHNVGGGLIGYSTDGYGVQKTFEDNGILLSGTSVLVVGSGGVARVCAFESAQNGAKVTIAARSKDKADLIAQEIRQKLGTRVTVININEISEHYDVLMQCTPVGMSTAQNAMPVRHGVIEKTDVVFDTIYSPAVTPLLAAAQRQGKKTIGGISMLVYQAAMAQTIWTGHVFTRAEMDRVFAAVRAGLEETN